MGGAKRYPSMGGAEGDGFRSALPILRLPVTLPRHCERSEAIHGAASGEVDCFAALAMTAERVFAFSRRRSPEVCIFLLPPSKIRGRREDRVLAAPAVPRAVCARQDGTRAYRAAGNTPAFPAQWLYGLLRALASTKSGRMCERTVLAKPSVAGSEPDRARRP